MGVRVYEGVWTPRIIFFSGRQRRRCVQDRVTVAGRLGCIAGCGVRHRDAYGTTGLQLELSA